MLCRVRMTWAAAFASLSTHICTYAKPRLGKHLARPTRRVPPPVGPMHHVGGGAVPVASSRSISRLGSVIMNNKRCL